MESTDKDDEMVLIAKRFHKTFVYHWLWPDLGLNGVTLCGKALTMAALTREQEAKHLGLVLCRQCSKRPKQQEA